MKIGIQYCIYVCIRNNLVMTYPMLQIIYLRFERIGVPFAFSKESRYICTLLFVIVFIMNLIIVIAMDDTSFLRILLQR
jgi:hypothetical protein